MGDIMTTKPQTDKLKAAARNAAYILTAAANNPAHDWEDRRVYMAAAQDIMLAVKELDKAERQ